MFILNLFVYTQIFKLKVENYVFQLTNDVCWRIAFLMLVSFRIFPNFASRFLVQDLPLLLPVHSCNRKLYPLGDVCGVIHITSVLNRKNGFASGKIGGKVFIGFENHVRFSFHNSETILRLLYLQNFFVHQLLYKQLLYHQKFHKRFGNNLE